jgi:streptogramin lyase
VLKQLLCIAMLIAASTAAIASCGGHAPFTFTTVGGTQVVDVSMGADFSLWAIGLNGVQLLKRGSGTQSLGSFPTSPGEATYAGRIAVGPDGSPWITGNSRHIYHLNFQTLQWNLLPGLANDIGVGANGSVWVIGTQSTAGGDHIYQWNGSSWIQEPSASGSRITVGPDGQPWVVNTSGQIWHRISSGNWSLFSGLGQEISVDFDNTPWVLGTGPQNEVVFHWTPDLGWQSTGVPPQGISITGGSGVPSCSGAFYVNTGGTVIQVSTT